MQVTFRKGIVVVGVMSGTSLDGLDVAAVRFGQAPSGQWQYNTLAANTLPWPNAMAQKLADSPRLSLPALLSLHAEAGKFIGRAVKGFLEQNRLQAQLVGCHGHTVLHDPPEGYSLQIGDAGHISFLTGLPVVSNFRTGDIAAGGQGAPLVPLAEEHLFAQYAACVNLGGIANVSCSTGGQRIGCDVCGCNLLLDRLAAKAGMKYDEDGKIAQSGTPDAHLLARLGQWEYLKLPPPKSLDKEQVLAQLWPMLENSPLGLPDQMATVAVLVAQTLAEAIGGCAKPGEVLVTGGGALNKYLMQQLSQRLPDGFSLAPADNQLVQYKEALVFAFMGLLRVLGQPYTLPSVTGAGAALCAGDLTDLYGRLPNLAGLEAL